MAESQAPYSYTQPLIQELELNLSSPRFSAYVRRAGHHRNYAIQLYLYNARLAKSILFPLHIMEVSLRNGIDSVLSNQFGENWPHEQSFRDILSEKSNNSLQKSINRFKKKIPSKDEVISELSLDFWSNLFGDEYDRSIWQTNMPNLFPETTITRKMFQPIIRDLNKFRNRIAHHEPILDDDINCWLRKILDVTAYRSASTSTWVKAHSTVSNMLRTKPKANAAAGPFLSDIVDRDIVTIAHNTTLDSAISAPHHVYLAKNQDGIDYAIFDNLDIVKYINSTKDGELIDLSEHTVHDLVLAMDCCNSFTLFEESETLTAATKALKKKIRFIACIDPSSPGRISGIVAKAHRRY
ncbi:hypothetical protein [Pseudomonas sp. NPDC008258]|uniref:hypothetical protein n=1 Tax=Pseudomonas sp. NPDC008258 TaxID=3364418 RepID=UPI0036E8F228